MEGLKGLIAACSAQPPQASGARIKAGEDIWFTGHAVPSEKGTVALAQTPNVNLIFNVDDIRAVHKQGERYFVSVSANANIMVGHQQVLRAEQATCACHGKGSAAPDEHGNALARSIGDRIDPDADVNFIEDWGCWWRFNCYTVWLPLAGSVRVCIPTGYFCS